MCIYADDHMPDMLMIDETKCMRHTIDRQHQAGDMIICIRSGMIDDRSIPVDTIIGYSMMIYRYPIITHSEEER